MITETAYGMSRRLRLPYEEALKRVKDALKEQGFGVLTEILARAFSAKEDEGRDSCV